MRSIRNTLDALRRKQNVDTLVGDAGRQDQRAVRWADLFSHPTINRLLNLDKRQAAAIQTVEAAVTTTTTAASNAQQTADDAAAAVLVNLASAQQAQNTLTALTSDLTATTNTLIRDSGNFDFRFGGAGWTSKSGNALADQSFNTITVGQIIAP